MGQYYDKDKFTGGGKQPPDYSDPPRRTGSGSRQQSQNSSGWYSWPLVILMFAIGAWPIALVLLFFNVFGGEKNQKRRDAAGARVERTVEDAVEKVMRTVDEKLSQNPGKADHIHKMASEMEQTIQRTADEVERTIRKNNGNSTAQQSYPKAEPAPKTKAKPKKAAKKKKTKAKPAGVLLRIIGACCLFFGGILGMGFVMELLEGWAELETLVASMGFLASGGVMFFRGQYLNRMSRRSQRYILAIGNVDAMPMAEIAKRVNRTPAKAAKELQKLIDKGYLGEDAYIDHEKGYFLRFGATLEEEEPVVEDPFEREEVPVQSVPEEAQEGYSGVLRNIRHANDRIADPELSRKIDRLEQVSALIFKEVEEHPEKRSTIHTFFDYYLPTTQKLLDAYADFEETGVEGEHLREAKERIEQTMDAIVGGFEHQLDQLYSADAMDVVSDIKVMEAMLNRDTASAARDFGYDQSRKKKDEDKGGGQTLQL